MIRLVLLAAAAAGAALPAGEPSPAAPPPTPPPALVGPGPAPLAAPFARLPGFAAALAQRPLPPAGEAWPALDETARWQAIAVARPEARQDARWNYATALIGVGRSADALGILDVMLADDADLAMVPAWRRAHGAALVAIGRTDAALAALADPILQGDPLSCAFRLLALAEADRARAAIGQFRCARPALAPSDPAMRRRLTLAVGRAGVAIGQYQAALAWLGGLADGDTAANLLRGKAMLALGSADAARLRFDRVRLAGTPAERAEASLARIEMDLADPARAGDAIKRLDALLFGWRGDAIEERALRLSMRIGLERHDDARTLAAGAMLFRYVNLGAGAATLATQLRQRLAAALASDATMPLDRAAGMFWDYRDLVPAGPEGDRLSAGLADRLQAAGLYARAADLLDRRLAAAVADVEQGPLSVRIATLRILAGTPDKAVRVLRQTDAIIFPTAMIADRRRVEAVALDLLGRHAEALAASGDGADTAGLRVELDWRARDWSRLAADDESVLPSPRSLNDVGQVIVMRHAIALAMLQNGPALDRLRARYAAAFATLPTAAAFAVLTAKAGSVGPAGINSAIAALPAASPAGDAGDLLDQGAAAMHEAKGK